MIAKQSKKGSTTLRKAKLWIVILILLFSGLVFSRPAAASAKVIVNPKTVYSYTRMVSDITKLKAAYPGLVNTKIIGKSEYGRNIYAVSLGNGPAKVFINGSHHAREWLTTNLNMYMIEQYAQAYIKKQKINGYDVRSILNTSTIWFVPMVNPDGVDLSINGSSEDSPFWSKLLEMNSGSFDFSEWKSNIQGVDLNRNYDAGWYQYKLLEPSLGITGPFGWRCVI
jgi:murein tripeptide amidase MpaA